MSYKEYVIRVLEKPLPPSFRETGDEIFKKNVFFKFNPNIMFIAHSTVIYEFQCILTCFCKLVKRIFPFIDVRRIYRDMIDEIANSYGTDKFTYYLENGNNIVTKLFSTIRSHLSTSKQNTGLLRITKRAIISVFDRNSRFYLMNQARQMIDNITEWKENLPTDFYRCIVNFIFSTVLLYEIESQITVAILETIRRDANKSGLANVLDIEYENLDLFFDRIPSYKFCEYFDEILYQLSNKVNESIFMRTLLAPRKDTSSSSSSYDQNDFVMLQNDASGPTYFKKSDFVTYGLAINDRQKTSTGFNGFTALGCALTVDPEDCRVIIKIAPSGTFSGEKRAFEAASIKGFAPLLIIKPFFVQSFTLFREKYNEGRSMIVYAMDKLTMTLEEVLRKDLLKPSDVDEIIEMLLRFEKMHFIHHDIKADNIMMKVDRYGRQRWYLIDFGSCWYGGPKYQSTSVPVSPENLPYGYNSSTLDQMRYPYMGYAGWSGLFLETPARHFDLCCLIMDLLVAPFNYNMRYLESFLAKSVKYINLFVAVVDLPRLNVLYRSSELSNYKPINQPVPKERFEIAQKYILKK